MAGLKYIKRDFVFHSNFEQEPVEDGVDVVERGNSGNDGRGGIWNLLKLMEGFVRETRERGDTAVKREVTRLWRRTEVVRSPREGPRSLLFRRGKSQGCR